MDFLQWVVGLSVTQVVIIHDYFQLYFDDKTIMNVYNRNSYDGDSILDLKGASIVSATETDVEILFIFDNGKRLSIGMRDEDFCSPEALTIAKGGTGTGLLAVW